ncbi:ScbR family autoregulator-binding transcription factor [Actinophytocola sp.]|uniref:ScbR family autoregulator-binding transcription factor n=1 Tax=Actinophytocola sp. TaxID=1872138 RepID=UPI002D808385|nr:ScbR family autoregulator-binding transcription factor [Actinophytocola sp.]HET9139819.1 ScbR family autoregulator-binding transcription factor [Actinophytocola sp.]
MPRQERAERTRANIIDAAAAMFDEYGFNGASLSDILNEAGVTKGALYFHFSSKEELAHALVTEQFGVQEPLQRESVGIQTAIDLCHEMAHALRTDVRVRASIRLVIETGSWADPSPDAYQQWIDVVRTYMESASERGDLRKELSPDDVARWVVGAFTGIQLSSQVLTGRADIHERVTGMWKIALPGLVPPRRLAKFVPSGTAGYGTGSATA